MSGNISYWDGTFTGGTPNIVTAVTRENGAVYLGPPSLHDGAISYRKQETWRSYGEEEAIFYWDGVNTGQLSEWYDIDGFFTPSTSSGGVLYVGRNAVTNLHEIRFVTSTGLCL